MFFAALLTTLQKEGKERREEERKEFVEERERNRQRLNGYLWSKHALGPCREQRSEKVSDLGLEIFS
jgi:hypothetical protein